MLGIWTTLSSQGTTGYNPVDSQVELKPSTEYLYNTLNIVSMKVYGSTDSEVRYKLLREEDRSPEFLVIVNETNTAITTVADTSAASNMVTLNAFIGETSEDVLTFTEAGYSGSTTEARRYNINDIVWGFENSGATITCLYIAEGGNAVKKIFVNHNLQQINDLITTGTTTTTTSSTSTTSA